MAPHLQRVVDRHVVELRGPGPVEPRVHPVGLGTPLADLRLRANLPRVLRAAPPHSVKEGIFGVAIREPLYVVDVGAQPPLALGGLQPELIGDWALNLQDKRNDYAK